MAAVILTSAIPSLGVTADADQFSTFEGGPAGDLSQLEAAAKRGDALAQARLGFAYHGRYPADENKATFWWRRAAEQGMPLSQCALGNAYRDGKGVPQDDTQAVLWWLKAALQGETEARFNLAQAYRSEKYVPQTVQEESMMKAEFERQKAVAQEHHRRGWDTPHHYDENGNPIMISR